MRDLTGRTAAITGAGSGIGRALAVRLADGGANLSLSDIDEAGLAGTAAQLRGTGVTVTTTRVDVADRAVVDSWAAQTVADHGSVHLVFNNAGVAQGGTVAGTDHATYEHVLGVNLWGVINGTKAFLPYLQAAGEGHVINISSVFGLQAQPGVSAYNASKFAVRGFTEALRQELDLLDTGVSATCVHPGGIKTNIMVAAPISESMSSLMGDAAGVADLFQRFLVTSPDRAARTILAGVRRDARRVLIGLDARVFDIEQRLLPQGYQTLNTAMIRTARRFVGALPASTRKTTASTPPAVQTATAHGS